ncbi:hypothetical protein QE250_11055 [Chromatiaceae bacterium AAb-1]|nr:hypothetical protein [Chromatiaceae bacterium AAb-1]
MAELKPDNLWQNWSALEQRLCSPDTAEQDYCRLVSDYTCVSCRLSTRLQQQQNLLLQEWCLRYCLFTLARCASSGKPDTQLRQLCLDQLYIPLLALQRLYLRQPNGRQQLNKLRLQLQQSFHSLR